MTFFKLQKHLTALLSTFKVKITIHIDNTMSLESAEKREEDAMLIMIISCFDGEHDMEPIHQQRIREVLRSIKSHILFFPYRPYTVETPICSKDLVRG
ncbi:hypothetical protein KQX54_014273 [Cotesia glomerata]|uniref:Uncharacterized protein n=1 Tax=Cotesia glomerata TaxID=32391 RepID=A0AAV7IY68_COTGL|nr:hypothetical protein KQX54_014273 [Cotesia glomerata]